MVGFLVVNFTTATDLSLRIVDLVATVYERKISLRLKLSVGFLSREIVSKPSCILTEIWAVRKMIFTIPDTALFTGTEIKQEKWSVKDITTTELIKAWLFCYHMSPEPGFLNYNGQAEVLTKMMKNFSFQAFSLGCELCVQVVPCQRTVVFVWRPCWLFLPIARL